MEVKIEKLVYGGNGLAHHDGQTVFVPRVLPGERVRVAPASHSKKFIRGLLEEVVEPSPERIAAPCSYFGRCGGCQYQHMPYETQLRYKSDILRETLARLGRIRWEGEIRTVPSPPFEYRNRAQWKIRSGGANPESGARDGAAGDVGIGYFEAGSNRLCAVDHCPIASPGLAATLKTLASLVTSQKLFSAIDEIEAFSSASDDQMLLTLSAERLTDSAEQIAAAFREALPAAHSILVQDRKADTLALFGEGFLEYAAAGARYQVGHLSFFQTNRYLIDALVTAVLGEDRGKLALDLFAGVGLFTAPLAQRFERVIGVESNAAAARDLEVNLQGSGGASAAHRNVTAESFLARWRDKPDLVVLDPPRAGVPAETLARLNAIAPERISYLSCDPATLARDLAVLSGSEKKPGPYQIQDVYLFDIFPQTYHMEALVRLRRRT